MNPLTPIFIALHAFLGGTNTILTIIHLFEKNVWIMTFCFICALMNIICMTRMVIDTRAYIKENGDTV